VIRVPFNRPFATREEIDYIRAAIATPKFSGDGSLTAQCHLLLEQSLGIQKALLTASCTHALEMAALLLDNGPEDEVMVPFLRVSLCGKMHSCYEPPNLSSWIFGPTR
jgi:dTDP-4-amino-4,6-dideoxygalactose transaminase